MENHIRINPEFTRAWNRLTYTNTKHIEDFVKQRHYTNVLFNPRQLTNLFPDIHIHNGPDHREITLTWNNRNWTPAAFVEHVQHWSSAQWRAQLLTPIFQTNFRSAKTLILAFLGRADRAAQLIHQISAHANKDSVAIAWCIRRPIQNDVVLPEWDNSVAYCCAELGSDIPPTLLLYDEIQSKFPDTQFKRIIKLHTKNDPRIFFKATHHALHVRANVNTKSACTGFRYAAIARDPYNRILLDKHSDLIHRPLFVPATIFATSTASFERVLEWFKSHLWTCLLQNMYDDNQTNIHCSYAHFMERLFGGIK